MRNVRQLIVQSQNKAYTSVSSFSSSPIPLPLASVEPPPHLISHRTAEYSALELDTTARFHAFQRRAIHTTPVEFRSDEFIARRTSTAMRRGGSSVDAGEFESGRRGRRAGDGADSLAWLAGEGGFG